MGEGVETVLYDEYYCYAMKTVDSLFGDTEQTMLKIFSNIEDIFDNLKIVLSRMLEILRNDSRAQALFSKYDVLNVFNDAEMKIEKRKQLEKDRISKIHQQENNHVSKDYSEEKLNFNNGRKIDI